MLEGQDHPIHVSDHAVVRFMERSLGLGELIEGIREDIRTACVPAIDFGAPIVIVHNVRLVIENGIVKTAEPLRGKRKSCQAR